MKAAFIALAGLLLSTGVALGAQVTCIPTAVVNGDGTTTITAQLCICLDPSEVDDVGTGFVTITFANACDLTENDPINDDEFGAAFPAGTYSVPLSAFVPLTICPTKVCAPIPGTAHSVSTDDYDDAGDPPGDWEYYEEGVPDPPAYGQHSRPRQRPSRLPAELGSRPVGGALGHGRASRTAERQHC